MFNKALRLATELPESFLLSLQAGPAILTQRFSHLSVHQNHLKSYRNTDVWDLRTCISNKFLAGADVAGMETPLSTTELE